MFSAVAHLPTVTFVKSRKRKVPSSEVPPGGNNGLKVSPILVDFGRLLKGNNKVDKQIIPGIPNLDVLHAVATLYGVSLSEVTDDIIYPTLCDKWSKTLLLVRDEEEARERLLKKATSHQPLKSYDEKLNEKTTSNGSLQEKSKALKEAEEDERFVNIFSDGDSSDEEDDDDEEEEDFTSGLNDFLRRVDERREIWRIYAEELKDVSTDQPPPFLGIEHRLVGCITFERSYQPSNEKVLQLSLIAVRRKFRGHGIGKFMIKQLFDPSITGGSDVIVVNADNNATDFFEKQGFTDDAILNSRWAHIGDIWFNSKRMCYLPAYQRHPDEEDTPFDLRQMELELALWKERSLHAYQSHASLIQRMRREILTLHARVSLQDDTIARLRKELDAREDADLNAKQDRMRRRIVHLRDAIDGFDENCSFVAEASDVTSSSAQDITSSSTIPKEVDTSSLSALHQDDDIISISSNQQESNVIKTTLNQKNDICSSQFSEHTDDDVITTPRNERGSDVTSSVTNKEDVLHAIIAETDNDEKTRTTEPDQAEQPSTNGTARPTNDNIALKSEKVSFREELKMLELREIKHCFITSMNAVDETFSGTAYDVINVSCVTSAELPLGIASRFEEAVKSSYNPDIVANLYYCGPILVDTGGTAFDRIMHRGFSASDFASSDYGRGLHFSRHARCAARFSPDGQVIVAKVCLGRTQTVTSLEPGRKCAPSGYDSILTQGRLVDTNTRHWSVGHSEYVVFKHDQAVPVALIQYQLMTS